MRVAKILGTDRQRGSTTGTRLNRVNILLIALTPALLVTFKAHARAIPITAAFMAAGGPKDAARRVWLATRNADSSGSPNSAFLSRRPRRRRPLAASPPDRRSICIAGMRIRQGETTRSPSELDIMSPGQRAPPLILLSSNPASLLSRRLDRCDRVFPACSCKHHLTFKSSLQPISIALGDARRFGLIAPVGENVYDAQDADPRES